MAVVSFSHVFLNPPPPPPRWSYSDRHVRSPHRHLLTPSPPSLRPPVLSFAAARRPPRCSSKENGGPPGDQEGDTERKTDQEEGQTTAASASASTAAAEIKEMMAERKKREEGSPDLLGGVVEEVREIEWPAFGRVLGTTGVVLAVIAGSSVALLTVNAVLAEISDRVFAGMGVQDFFG